MPKLMRKRQYQSADSGWTPLHEAAAYGHVHLLKYYLNTMANSPVQYAFAVDTRTSETKETPLHVAAAAGQVAVVEFLLSHKANAEARNAQSYTPLLCAADQNQLLVVEKLIAFGVNTNAWRAVDQATCLHLAARNGNVDLVRFLVKHMDVDLQNLRGVTALHVAARAGHCAMVDVLVHEFHANVHHTDDRGRTVLHHAVDYTPSNDWSENEKQREELHRMTLIRLLLDAGADGRTKPKASGVCTSVIWCAVRRRHSQIVRFLLAHCAKKSKLSVAVLAFLCGIHNTSYHSFHQSIES